MQSKRRVTTRLPNEEICTALLWGESTATAMSLPKATVTKCYATFKLLHFDKPNANKDGFHREDVGDKWETIKGSDVNYMHWSSWRLGTVLDAMVDEEDGSVVCLEVLHRRALADLEVDPKALPETHTASMEVKFYKKDCKYQVGGAVYTYEEALERKIAENPLWFDDPANYDARWIVPVEFSGVALCPKGTEADHEAVYLKSVATQRDQMRNAGGAKVNEELEKFKKDELPGLIAQAKAEGVAEAKAAAEMEFRAQLDAKATEMETKVAEAKAQAVEEYKAAEAKAQERFAELGKLLPYADEEKATALEAIRAMDEVQYLTAKADRAVKAAEDAKAKALEAEAKATANGKQDLPPSLTGGGGEKTVKSIWSKPVEE
jgi:hypothetical protein